MRDSMAVRRLALAAIVLAAPLPARADSVADFYRGKEIRLVIGASVGGGSTALLPVR